MFSAAKASDKAQCAKAEQAVNADSAPIQKIFVDQKFGDAIVICKASVSSKGCDVKINFAGRMRRKRLFKGRQARGFFTVRANVLADRYYAYPISRLRH